MARIGREAAIAVERTGFPFRAEPRAPLPASEQDLAAAALALGADTVDGWTSRERRRAARIRCRVPPRLVRNLAERIRAGLDPLGEAFCALRSPAERRPRGAVYTPPAIVSAMGAWAAEQGAPARVVDPGVGSGRFLLDAARRFPHARLLGIDVDPLAVLVARANLATVGTAGRSHVRLADYRRARLPECSGTTLFLGNPPYVRHHLLSTRDKLWLASNAAKRGLSASRLAGLHAHFFLATLLKGRKGDYGAFISAAEWLDVNYGSLVRAMLLGGLGGRSITVIEPSAGPFPGIAATGAIATFRIETRPETLRLRRIEHLTELDELRGGAPVSRDRLRSERRWSRLTSAQAQPPGGYVELGELCRVHRGQVTGANRVWIAGPHSRELPRRVLYRTVTRAKDVIEAGGAITRRTELRSVIDLPVDLGDFELTERQAIERFLETARAAGAHSGYIARRRKAWWSVGLAEPAAIIATYMARRPPAYALNEAGVRHINIAHGIYPREPLPRTVLANLAAYLSGATSVVDGRTYAGGLTKFEPREMERIKVPPLDLLAQAAPGR